MVKGLWVVNPMELCDIRVFLKKCNFFIGKIIFVMFNKIIEKLAENYLYYNFFYNKDIFLLCLIKLTKKLSLKN